MRKKISFCKYGKGKVAVRYGCVVVAYLAVWKERDVDKKILATMVSFATKVVDNYLDGCQI